jgi:DNA-binding Lrp family transcriptional regulator
MLLIDFDCRLIIMAYKTADMDSLDQQIIDSLRRNGRVSVSDLATQVGVTRTTVRTRMEKLEAAGEILGYTVILRNDEYALPVRGIMLIKIAGSGTDKIIARLNGLPEVSAIHTTNGAWDLIIELGTDTLSSLDDVLRRIRLIDGISASETNLYLTTKRSTRRR